MSVSVVDGRFRIRFSGVTDVGRVRAHNEDDLLIPVGELPLAVVADGMGGHASGDVASKLAVQTLHDYYQKTATSPPSTWPFRLPQQHIEQDRMKHAIKLANTRIHETGLKDPSKKNMGCTIDAVFFSQERLYIGHVGDSRVYRIRGGHIDQLTEDHSLLNDYRRMTKMTGEDMENFAHKNVVVRALGLASQVYVDLLVDEVHLDDMYLLCSDGLCGMLSDQDMLATILRFNNLDNAANQLVVLANEAGGNDNITALLARVEAA